MKLQLVSDPFRKQCIELTSYQHCLHLIQTATLGDDTEGGGDDGHVD